MKMTDDRKRQKRTTIIATDEVFVTQHSEKGRYYTEQELPIIWTKQMHSYVDWKIEMPALWNNDKNKNL